jgi:hypothetical protein
MPFQTGNTDGKGRPKGSKNKTVQLVEDLVTKLNVDPLEILMLFAKGDWKALGYKSESTIAYTSAGIEYEKMTITPDHRVNAATSAVKYIYSQKKAIELSNQVESEGFRIIVEDYTKK